MEGQYGGGGGGGGGPVVEGLGGSQLKKEAIVKHD